MRQERNYSLLSHNTFGIEAKAECFVEFDTTAELVAALSQWRATGKPMLVIGGGSNLLFTRDYPGWVFHSAIRGFEVCRQTDDFVFLRVGSGEVWDHVIQYCLERNLSGGENLSLIPGEVGASAVQNIGAYGVEAKDFIETVEAVDVATGEKAVFTNAECRYAYRQSAFKQELKGRFVITHVTYRFARRFYPQTAYGALRSALQNRGEELTPALLRNVIIDIRRSKLPDPGHIGNAGSFFMNPIVPNAVFEALLADYPQMPHYRTGEDAVKIPAGWLIEQCGWKGKAMGTAAVYDKQALVLINRGGATGADIMALCRAIQHDVKQRFHIEIRPEVNII